MMLIITWRCSLLFKLFDFIRAHKFLTGYGLLLIFSLWPTRFSDVYDAVPAERIFDELVQRTTPNMVRERGVRKMFIMGRFSNITLSLSPSRLSGMFCP